MDYEIFPGDDDSLVRYGQKFRIVDVREDHECRERPIVSDYRIPFSQFDASKLAAAPETPLLVVCEHGQRSLVVTSLLREKGWLNAFSLHTGLHGLELTRVYSTPDRAA